MGCIYMQPTFTIMRYDMATHFAELEHALKMLKQLTGISLDIHADTPEEEEQALIQVRRLYNAYREKYTPGQFLQNLLTQDLPAAEMLREAGRLHISLEEPRVLFLLEMKGSLTESAAEILKLLFPAQAAKALIPVNESQLAIAYTLRASETEEEIRRTAHMIVDTLSAEALVSVKLAYSARFDTLSTLRSVYEETALALRIGQMFYPEQNIFCSDQLGIGRLIVSLPLSVCEQFLNEIWGGNALTAMDEEITSTVNCFLQNNLNIAETARQLHMHRNTLIYRIGQVQKQTGLDLRNFEDAMQFKIAAMIRNYVRTTKITGNK